MSDLKKLPEYSDRILHNLYADNDLKNKIISEASQPEKAASIWSGKFIKAVPVLACAAVLLVTLTALNPFRTTGKTDIYDFPAGEIKTADGGNASFISVGKSNDGSGIYAGENEKNSLICIDDRCFVCVDDRVITDTDLYGEKIGEVNEYSDSPELAEMAGIASNSVVCGTAVYAVSGMENAFVLTAVSDGCKVYQRISYGRRSASSDLGDSGLQDICGHITAISADGKYAEISPEENDLLSSMLLSGTGFISSEYADLGHILIIYLENGLHYTLSYGDFKISGCGTWGNPEFLDEIERIIK